MKGERDVEDAEEWIGMTPAQSVLSTVHVVRKNLALHPFTAGPTWPSQRFYNDGFHQELELKRKRVCGESSVY